MQEQSERIMIHWFQCFRWLLYENFLHNVAAGSLAQQTAWRWTWDLKWCENNFYLLCARIKFGKGRWLHYWCILVLGRGPTRNFRRWFFDFYTERNDVGLGFLQWWLQRRAGMYGAKRFDACKEAHQEYSSRTYRIFVPWYHLLWALANIFHLDVCSGE